VTRVGRLLEVAKPDRWTDDVTPSDIEPLFLCSACGKRGSEVAADFNWNHGSVALSMNDKPRRRLYLDLGNAIDFLAFDCYGGPAQSAIPQTNGAVSWESLPRPDFTCRQLQIFCFGYG